MKIAILGWGSLIWDPRSLKIEKNVGTNGWDDKGPKLPIEFARISQDGRLTLVIDPTQEQTVQTRYAISECKEFDHAILNLAIREGCNTNQIGHYIKDTHKFSSKNPSIEKSITDWITGKDNIDAVIWTDLSPNFKVKTEKEFTEENAVNHLKSLTCDIKARAEEYIRKTPTVINTPIREKIEKELGWTAIHS